MAEKQNIRQVWFQHTAARRRLDPHRWRRWQSEVFQHTAARRRLDPTYSQSAIAKLFQHTAARRRLEVLQNGLKIAGLFQHTAARRRLAWDTDALIAEMRFNTQPPEGGWKSRAEIKKLGSVSTHSRPKAAGMSHTVAIQAKLFQHTAARRRLVPILSGLGRGYVFQHTAARRRLVWVVLVGQG